MATATKTYPASAFRMMAEGVEFGSNGDGAKSIPVTIVARSAQPMEHWAFGRIVHDLGGVRHKSKLTIDYVHDENQVLGFANKFNTTPRGLELSGALVPFGNKETDRAREVIHKAANGVDYQASIFWGADDAVFQYVAENEVAPVNGYDFQGPGIIVRQWSLFGVAICPYGADENTSTEFAALAAKCGGDRQVTIQLLEVPEETRRFAASTPPPSDEVKEPRMPVTDPNQTPPTTPPVEPPKEPPATPPAAPAVETPAAETPPVTPAAPAAEHEEPDDELEAANPATPAATPPADPPALAATPPAEQTAEQIRATEGKRFVDKFGAERGAKYFTEGLAFAVACDRWGADLQTENRQLRDRLAKFAGGCETPPIFDPAEKAGSAAGSGSRDELTDRVGPGVAQYVRAMQGQGQAAKQ